jgi:hypothetical protein
MSDDGDIVELGGKTVLVCPDDGPSIASERDAMDLIALSFGRDIFAIAISAGRFDPAFFQLSSGVLGAVTQKFVNYQCHLAIVGDIAAHEAKSAPFRDFVRETNKGRHIWFLPDREALARKLASAG